jgi:hypothetical protein
MQLSVMTHGGQVICNNISEDDSIRFIQWMSDDTAKNMYILQSLWGQKKTQHYFLKQKVCSFSIER